MSYQKIQEYSGSMYGDPSYLGIEYDWEVPDNMVVASPGGVSTTHHHYTKGFYGDGSVTNNVYGGEGLRYPYAEFGNLYSSGQTAPQQIGEYFPAPDRMFTENETGPYRDNYTPVPMDIPNDPNAIPQTNIDNFSLDKIASSAVSDAAKKLKLSINPWYLFILIVIAYIAMDFWAAAGSDFIKQKFHGGKDLGWQHLIIVAVIFTGLLVGFAYFFDISIIRLEHV